MELHVFSSWRLPILSAILLSAVCRVRGYSTFRKEIPNGFVVPHPCKPNTIWDGVGHNNQLGGGDRNPFGQDFEKNGKKWDTTLCQKDSDGDGRSNGEELGDANCQWTKGMELEQTADLSHPGICEPVNSVSCRGKSDFVSCDVDEWRCDAMKDNDTLTIPVRLPKSPVPSQETTYICVNRHLGLPETGDYHLIATEPIIDNYDVIHHIIVYGCRSDADLTYAIDKPYSCDMLPDEACEEIIALWSFGYPGGCYHSDVGFRMGIKGYRTVAIEMHWNNPFHRQDYTDTSGVLLYLTPNIRQFDAGIFAVGQISLTIPPGSESHEEIGNCPSRCTKSLFTGDLHIVGSVNHMHYLGVQQRTELYRNDRKITDLAYDQHYTYDNPAFHRFSDPIVIKPGDHIKTSCIFNSTSKATTTKFGQQTSDEMCFAFLLYYPKENVKDVYCYEFRQIAWCDWDNEDIQGCRHEELFNPFSEEFKMFTHILGNCSYTGQCLKECLPVARRVKEHPCFKNDYGQSLREEIHYEELAERVQAMQFFMALHSCDTELALQDHGPTTVSTTSGSSSLLPAVVLTILVSFVP